jgi:hypothetical protein
MTVTPLPAGQDRRCLDDPLARLLLVFAFAAVIFAWGHGSIAQILDLYPNDLPAHPRFIIEHAWLLYVEAPLTIVSTLLLLLAPGVLFVLLLGGRPNVAELMLKGFVASFALRFFLHGVWKLAGRSVTPGVFLAIEVSLSGALAVLVLLRKRRRGIDAIWLGPGDGWRVARLLAVPFVFVAVCTPEIFWKDLIGDGFETLYSGSTLSEHVVTRFATESGFYGIGLGLLSQAYPVSWFGNLFGFTEPAARLPVGLYAMMICAAIIALTEWNSSRRLRWSEEAALAMSVAACVVTLGWNASYNSYAADLAAPLAVELLTVLTILGVVFAWWSDRRGWMLAFAVIGNFNRPNMILVLGALAVATLWLRHENWRRALVALLLAAATCIILSLAYERIYLARATSEAVEGLNVSVLNRIRFLKFTDVRRLIFVLIPSGLLPALALLAYRRQENYARQISILTAIYFGVFYVEAYYSLHHFAPVMVLPVVVLWRMAAGRPFSRAVAATAVAAGAVAIVVSFPWGRPIARDVQTIARSIELRLPHIDPVAVGGREFAERRRVLGQVFPPEWRVDDTKQTWGFDVVALAYHAHRVADHDNRAEATMFRIQSRSEPAPSGWELAATTESLAGLVRDRERLGQALSRVPSTRFANGLYRIRREELLWYRGTRVPIHQVDLLDLARRTGLARYAPAAR